MPKKNKIKDRELSEVNKKNKKKKEKGGKDQIQTT